MGTPLIMTWVKCYDTERQQEPAGWFEKKKNKEKAIRYAVICTQCRRVFGFDKALQA